MSIENKNFHALHETLLFVVEKYGKEKLKNNIIIGLITDLLPNIEKKYINILKQAVHDQIVLKLLEIDNYESANKNILIQKLKVSFKDNNGFNDSADYLFDSFLNALGFLQSIPSDSRISDIVEEYNFGVDLSERDTMFDDAARLIVIHQKGSTSLIQRMLKLGYNRSGSIIDQLEAAGIVGPFEGSRAREVLISDLNTLEELLSDFRNEIDESELETSQTSIAHLDIEDNIKSTAFNNLRLDHTYWKHIILRKSNHKGFLNIEAKSNRPWLKVSPGLIESSEFPIQIEVRVNPGQGDLSEYGSSDIGAISFKIFNNSGVNYEEIEVTACIEKEELQIRRNEIKLKEEEKVKKEKVRVDQKKAQRRVINNIRYVPILSGVLTLLTLIHYFFSFSYSGWIVTGLIVSAIIILISVSHLLDSYWNYREYVIDFEKREVENDVLAEFGLVTALAILSLSSFKIFVLVIFFPLSLGINYFIYYKFKPRNKYISLIITSSIYLVNFLVVLFFFSN